MTYCVDCGIMLDSYDCPICGCRNFKPQKPGEKRKPAPKPDKVSTAELPLPPTAGSLHAAEAAYSKRPMPLMAGFTGSFLLGISAIILGLVPMYNAIEGDVWSFESSLLYFLYIAGTFIFLIGSAVLAVGFYGLYKEYGSNLSLTVMIFNLVSPLILLIFTVAAIHHEAYVGYNYSHAFYEIGISLWLGHLYVGIMFITMGLALRNLEFKLGVNGANIPVGSTFVVAGTMFILFMGIPGFAWIVVSVAAIVMATHFIIAKPYVARIPTPAGERVRY